MIYVEKFDDMINDDIDEWVYFFKHGSIRDNFKSPGILLAASKLDYIKMSEEERRSYDDYLAYLGQELGILDTAKAEGRVEGRVEGKVEGRVEGRVEGKEERSFEIAKNLLFAGVDLKTIMDSTGLNEEEIKKL